MPNAQPRGSRHATDACIAARCAADAFDGLPDGMDRLELIRLVKSAGGRIGMNRSQIDYLAFQVAYTRDCDWRPGARPIAYATVTTAARRLEVGERQIRRLERSLNELGALGWNDSANHRRTGKRDPDTGRILFAYGVDLAPLAALIPELQQQQRQQDAENAAWDAARRRCGGLKRSIRALRDRAEDEGWIDPESDEWTDRTAILDYRVRASTPLAHLEDAVARLAMLEAELRGLAAERSVPRPAVENPPAAVEMSSRADSGVRRIDTTSKSGSGKATCSGAPARDPGDAAAAGAGVVSDDDRERAEDARRETLFAPLHAAPRRVWRADTGTQWIAVTHVLGVAGERFLDHLPPAEQPGWPEIARAAEDLCPLLGIAARLWREATALMGRRAAAVCVALIDLRARPDAADPIRNPGGYFRACLERARRDELHLHASLFARLRHSGAQLASASSRHTAGQPPSRSVTETVEPRDLPSIGEIAIRSINRPSAGRRRGAAAGSE